MKTLKDWRLTYKEKKDILRRWNGRQVGIGEINYVEELVLQKVIKEKETDK